MQKYGFFGGSFNPVTNAHVDLANEIIKQYNLDKVMFVPVGDNYKKEGLISEKHRYNMLKIALKEYKNLEVSDIELKQNKNLTTLEAFKKIEQEYKEIERYFIIGGDNLLKILSSEDSKILLENYKYIVIERNNIDLNEIIKDKEIFYKNKENFIFMKNIKHRSTSSTKARKILWETKEVNIIGKEVLNYIKTNKLYK